ncbi:MAG: DinB family protein [Acidobacteriota bacterium]|nr:DinB family protein [Acidobacteriota bacterium]
MSEPWLRGPIPDTNALIAPILRSFQQAREDLATYTEGLTPDQVWARPHGLGSLGFHLRHIAGSVDRLTTYLEERSLDHEHMAALNSEMEPGASRKELLAALDVGFAKTEQVIRLVELSKLSEVRTVGRMHLPTTVIGLLVHLAEHTQRHVGQAISAAKLARAAVA